MLVPGIAQIRRQDNVPRARLLSALDCAGLGPGLAVALAAQVW